MWDLPRNRNTRNKDTRNKDTPGKPSASSRLHRNLAFNLNFFFFFALKQILLKVEIFGMVYAKIHQEMHQKAASMKFRYAFTYIQYFELRTFDISLSIVRST